MAAAWAAVTVRFDWSDGTIDDYDLYGGARNTLSLGPGEVARFFVYDEEMPDLFGADSHQRVSSPPARSRFARAT